MEKLKSNLPNMVLVLTGVALVCGALLAYMNNLTKPAIDEQAEKALAEGIKNVLSADAVKVEKTDTVKRTINNKEQTFVVYKTDKGTAVQSTDPNGFGGNLKVLVGFNEAGDILGYTVLEHAETPGLGAKASEWFQKDAPGCIVGLNPGKAKFIVSKDGGDIDAITASTITSRSFLRAVQEAYNTFNENGAAANADANTAATKQECQDANTAATKQECKDAKKEECKKDDSKKDAK